MSNQRVFSASLNLGKFRTIETNLLMISGRARFSHYMTHVEAWFPRLT